MRLYPAEVFVPVQVAPDWRWPAATFLLLVLLIAANPIGYRGGGADDWQYLQAARCWAEQGACLPRDHWWGRWPLVAPMAALIGLFGESRLVLAIPPFAATAACATLIAIIGNRLFAAPAGWLAAMLYVSTPVVLFEALDPTVDNLELAALLATALLLLKAGERRDARLYAAAGLALGLAFQVRETSIAAFPAIGLFLWLKARKQPAALLAFAAAALVPLMLELLVYGLATGDPLLRRGLSVAHTSLPSSELAAATPAGALPFFRWPLIAGWQHETGVSLHWLIDGPLEVLLNSKGAWTIGLAIGALLLLGERLPAPDRRRAAVLLAIALTHGLLLIFALSIDPKPRMMLVPLACASLILGALLSTRLAALALLLVGARAAALLVAYLFEPRMAPAEAVVPNWLSALPPGSIETTESTRRRLALVPAVEALPLAEGSRSYLLVRTSRPCAQARLTQLIVPRSLELVSEQRLGPASPLTGKYKAMCLYRYRGLGAGPALALAHDSRTPFTDEGRERFGR